MDKQASSTARRAGAPVVHASVRRQAAAALLLLALLVSCARPARSPKPVSEVTPAIVDTRGAQVYTVDANASRVHILVYRGGALARLGHNHVVTSKSVAGRAWLNPEIERSGFELTIPVASLIVDDQRDREAHGEDFPPGISQKDIEGTKRNMLRADVLDAERYPTISLKSAKVSGNSASPVVSARITLKGVTKDVRVPLRLAADATRLTASGALDILQTEFGIKPFSIALGALEVQDRLHLEFNIVANAES